MLLLLSLSRSSRQLRAVFCRACLPVCLAVLFLSLPPSVPPCSAAAPAKSAKMPPARNATPSPILTRGQLLQTIARARVLQKQNKYAEAVALLESKRPAIAALSQNHPRRKLRLLALADAQFAWAKHLLGQATTDAYQAAAVHCQAAYGIDVLYRRRETALDIHTLGRFSFFLKQYTKALSYYERALSIRQQIGDREGEANTIYNLGNVYFALQRYEKALTYYKWALPIYQHIGNRKYAAETLVNMGFVSRHLSQYSKALSYFERALPIYQQIGDREGAAETLYNLGFVYNQLSQYSKALPYFERALPIYQQIGDRKGAAETLYNLGFVYNQLSQYSKALPYFEQSLRIKQKIGDRSGEASTLNSLGVSYENLNQYAMALSSYERALVIRKQLDDRKGEAATLINLGDVDEHLNQHAIALSYYERALQIRLLIGDRKGEAYTLNSLGDVCKHLGQSAKALSYYERALVIYQQLGDREGKADTLSNLGNLCRRLSQYYRALSYYERALPIQKQIGDLSGEADTLNDIGTVYDDLGQSAKALSYYVRALLIWQQLGNRSGEATTLYFIGSVYDDLRQYSKALSCSDRALVIYQQLGDRDGEAIALNILGSIYRDSGQNDKALQYCERALTIQQQIGDRDGEFYTLNNLGNAYLGLRQYAESRSSYERALVICQQLGIRGDKADTLSHLSALFSTPGFSDRNPALSIFFGKQAVGLYQSIWSDNKGLNKSLRKSFTQSVSDDYRKLADVLIAEGRLPEAQQVLDLLKEQEAFDFVRRDPTRANAVSEALALTPAEESTRTQYEQIAGKVTALGADLEQLESKQRSAATAKTALTETDAKRLTMVRAQLATANAGFHIFLEALPERFASAGGRKDEMQALAAAGATREKQTYLAALSQATGKKAVLLNVLVGQERTYVLLTTPSAQTAEAVPIAAADLNRLVARFRQALMDPRTDPRPLGKKLYDLLLGPLQKQLDGADAQTLLLTLDGTVRYIPLAALSPDGKTFLAERYRVAIVTPGSFQTDALRTPSGNAAVLGLGVTGGHDVTLEGESTPLHFAALPGVRQEIGAVTGAAVGGAGSRSLLDAQFTTDTILGGTIHQFSIVHIASHFYLGRDDAHSFLLTGAGTPLTLRTMGGGSRLFAGVDLLLLSACDTATGGVLSALAAPSVSPGDKTGKMGSRAPAGNGGEVDSFALVAQEQGAQAILATLWPVADKSTVALMTEFYRLRRSEPDLSKPEALRRAQVALITGTIQPDTVAAPADGRGMTGSAAPRKPDPELPPYTGAKWAHPYYWAPFILIGNAR